MKTIITLLLTFCISTIGLSQTSAMEAWKSLLDKKELADYFSGIFNSMGFVVEETNERFTVYHKGDHFTIEQGIDENTVDYIAYLKQENIENMLNHGADNTISEFESFRIMSVLFTPLTEASLTNPTLTKPVMRKLSGIENHIHVNLIDPTGEATVSHTLIYLNKKWMVVPGTRGDAKRVFNLTPQDAIDYQRKVFIALQQDNMKDWKEFKKWYMEWRKQVSDELSL